MELKLRREWLGMREKCLHITGLLRLPCTAWTQLGTVEGGGWGEMHVEPFVIPATMGLDRSTYHSEETRRQMSATHRQQGTLVPGTIPWTAEEDELVRALPTQEAVRRTGRTISAVKARQRRLGVPDGRRRG